MRIEGGCEEKECSEPDDDGYESKCAKLDDKAFDSEANEFAKVHAKLLGVKPISSLLLT